MSLWYHVELMHLKTNPIPNFLFLIFLLLVSDNGFAETSVKYFVLKHFYCEFYKSALELTNYIGMIFISQSSLSTKSSFWLRSFLSLNSRGFMHPMIEADIAVK